MPAPVLSPTAASPARIQAIDVVRGLVMVIMALDHVRDFWNATPMRAEDVSQASALLFLTRWITHFCAPTFVFLAGVSIFLLQQRRPSRAATSRFLLTRGLWLVGLELVVFSFILQWGYPLLLLLVIWAIGWGMVLLAGLLWLPRRVLAGLAFVLVAGHNVLPGGLPPGAPTMGGGSAWGLLLHPPFVLPLPGLPPLLVAYAIGPWLGVLLAGYVVGPWYRLPLPERNRRLRRAGLALLALFGVLRFTNWYGDPSPWAAQARGGLYSVLSFVNVTKSPPSLLFVCLTLGGALLLLSGAEQATGRVSRWLRTFGQVPFFYYLLHFSLISGSAWVWSRLQFGHAFNFAFAKPADWPAGYAPSLLRAYLVWAAVVLAAYWPCRWYQQFRQRHSYWWLSYL